MAKRGERVETGSHGPYQEPTSPPTRRSDWELLGYDVGDPTISALSNCGYSPEEKAGPMQRWESRLNEHHLFTDLKDAYEFLMVSNRRVPEHAPFFTLGLWRIP